MTSARPARIHRWSMGAANGPQTNFSSKEHVEEQKTTIKMKPHRIRKPSQVAAGQSIQITNIVINTYALK